MNYILKGLQIIYPGGSISNPMDLHVKDGKVFTGPQDAEQSDCTVLDYNGCYALPGFTDLNAGLGKDGLDSTETLETFAAAAQAGGFNHILLQPVSAPLVQTAEIVEALKLKGSRLQIEMHIAGAASLDGGGSQLTELNEMKIAGAAVFSNGDELITDAEFMHRLMGYARGIDARIMVTPRDKGLAGKAQVAEGKRNYLLGMKGIPAIAEEIIVSRDLSIASYIGWPVHFSNISTAEAIKAIARAREQGMQVTCDVAVAQLLFTEDDLTDFDSNYKVMPPLRSKKNQDALKEAVKTGVIDAVGSYHRPVRVEEKMVEFEIAAYGMIQLQTAFCALVKAGFTITEIADCLSYRPRTIMGISAQVFTGGAPADFVVVDMAGETRYTAATNKSKSKNSPLLNQVLPGKVMASCFHNSLKIYE